MNMKKKCTGNDECQRNPGRIPTFRFKNLSEKCTIGLKLGKYALPPTLFR